MASDLSDGSGVGNVSIAVANAGVARHFDDPEALLDRYHALVGWADAVVGAGAAGVTVVQRFRRDAVIRHHAVEYRFVADGAGTSSQAWFRGDRMARALAALGPDVVHVNGGVFPLFVDNMRRRLPPRAAIVVQDHGGSGIQDQAGGLRTALWQRFHRFGLKGVDGFLFTARELAAPWMSSGIIDGGQAVYEIPEASTDLASRARGSRTAGRLPGRPALLWVARLDANKDPLTILTGFEQALSALPDAELTLAFGEDDLLPAVTSRIASSPALRDRVHLRGNVDRDALGELYEGADLFLLGSHREVASFALIEALAFGVIPIVSDIPAFRALTGGGRVGALFPPGDAPALARSIESVTRGDLPARKELVRAHFARELSWSTIGGRALAIYRAAAARRRGRIR